jgi:hypothetical protein
VRLTAAYGLIATAAATQGGRFGITDGESGDLPCHRASSGD